MVSIIICTYNRDKLLRLCLESILKYNTHNPALFEIIIVDNNSTDTTKDVVFEIKNSNKQFRYVFEEKIGLSIARNTGANHAKYSWLFYLDDDALIQEDTLNHCISTIKNFNFVFFGGMYNAYYINEKPKWLPKNFSDKTCPTSKISEIEVNAISGCIMVVKKEILFQTGGFKSHLGMKGNIVSYGEETLLFQEIKSLGLSIGFNPHFKIHHIVAQHKQKLHWHLISHYKKGKAHELIYNNLNLKIISQESIKGIKFIVLAIMEFFNNKEYYYQNLILDCTKKILELAGRFSVVLLNRI